MLSSNVYHMWPSIFGDCQKEKKSPFLFQCNLFKSPDSVWLSNASVPILYGLTVCSTTHFYIRRSKNSHRSMRVYTHQHVEMRYTTAQRREEARAGIARLKSTHQHTLLLWLLGLCMPPIICLSSWTLSIRAPYYDTTRYKL